MPLRFFNPTIFFNLTMEMTMKVFGQRAFALLTLMAVLSGCSSHCSCPPPMAPSPTTIIHEEPRD